MRKINSIFLALSFVFMAGNVRGEVPEPGTYYGIMTLQDFYTSGYPQASLRRPFVFRLKSSGDPSIPANWNVAGVAVSAIGETFANEGIWFSKYRTNKHKCSNEYFVQAVSSGVGTARFKFQFQVNCGPSLYVAEVYSGELQKLPRSKVFSLNGRNSSSPSRCVTLKQKGRFAYSVYRTEAGTASIAVNVLPCRSSRAVQTIKVAEDTAEGRYITGSFSLKAGNYRFQVVTKDSWSLDRIS